ncbi:MAG: GspE/PulE family protein [Candidatus Taylorbacteria bacterium]|nr:GspE/PulE family protein [Candidatus Taylorbacteria bacterium]
MQEKIYQIMSNERMLHDIGSVVELVDSLLIHGYHRNSSDVHIDPTGEGIVVRYRVDGVLTYVDTLDLKYHEELIARIKVLAGLRTDIHFVPQDGRFRFFQSICDCDVRVSIIPTHYGENAVLRILKNENEIPTLGKLGFSDHDVDRIMNCLSYHQGMVLVTGPTGSGKTSTLYTLISTLQADKHSIITLEDPIEYAIEGVRQIAIHARHGITFGNGLRSIVRQDPDIIMVGEIRDIETAQIATNISLTGHLLLSTLHTNSALGAIPRLIDMGVDPYLVASTLSLVIAQRLVRKVCEHCKGAGCGACGNLGFKGRTVVAETLVVDEELRKYIMSRTSIGEINRYVRSKGMRTMYEDGIDKVEEGITTEEEIARILHE